MEIKNEYVVTGTLKNIRQFTGSRGTLVTGWFDQRTASRLPDDTLDRMVYVVGMNIVALDDSTVGDLIDLDKARQGNEHTQLVTLKGRMVTRFDRRDIPEKRAPQLQFEVLEVSTN